MNDINKGDLVWDKKITIKNQYGKIYVSIL